MATYKVLQDIEAEDKLLGPLSLKQFIFASITVVCLYMSFFALTKHATFLLVFLLPPALVGGFLAWPWSRDQPTEIWLLAKISFFLKPRRRIWNQDGIQELVTITAPKKIEEHLTNDLSQTEVKSRLRALAETIDSRGWAIKNVNVNLSLQPSYLMPDPTSDRLIDLSMLPTEVSNVDVAAADDIMDTQNNLTAQHLDQMIGASSKEHRQQLMQQVQDFRDHPSQPTATPAAPTSAQDLWFVNSQQPTAPASFSPLPPVAIDDDKSLLAQLHPDSLGSAAYGRMKVVQPLGDKPLPVAQPTSPSIPAVAPPTPPAVDPAIIELANNDDLNVSTIARQAKKARDQEPPDEIVVSLR